MFLNDNTMHTLYRLYEAWRMLDLSEKQVLQYGT